MCGPKPPSAPVLPQYPDLTPAQQTNVGQQAGVSGQFGDVIQGASGQLGQNTNILQQLSGLFNSDGTINQTALAALQSSAQQSNQTAAQSGNTALASAGSQYGAGGPLAATEGAYTNALQNGAPANQQIAFQQKQAFQQMQQQAAQRGINITGTDFSNAVSDSSAGQKLIQNFQQNANIQNQNYNLGYVGQLAGNMGQLANTAGQTATTGMGLAQYSQQNPLGMVQSSISNGQSALAPLLSSYQNQLTSAYQPLYMQQIGPYQQQMAQQQSNYQAGTNSSNFFNNQNMGFAQLGMQGIGFGANAYAANQNKQGMMALAAA